MGSKLRKLRVKAGLAGVERRRQRIAESFERDRAATAARNAEREASAAAARQQARDEKMRRVLDEVVRRAGASNKERKAGCIDPSLHRELSQQAQVFDLPLPDPLHWADYLSELEAKASGLGQVCRVCGKAKPEKPTLVVDSSDVSAAAAIAQVCGGTESGSREPAPGASVGPEVRLYETPSVLVAKPDARPPAAGMRLTRLQTVLAMSMLFGMAALPKEDR
jgi:hypothetical protein